MLEYVNSGTTIPYYYSTAVHDVGIIYYTDILCSHYNCQPTNFYALAAHGDQGIARNLVGAGAKIRSALHAAVRGGMESSRSGEWSVCQRRGYTPYTTAATASFS